MGIIGVISALLTGLMVYFRRQVSALLTKINQPPFNVPTHGDEAVTTSDDSELTARLLALRQLASTHGIATAIQQQQPQTASSPDNTAFASNPPPPPPSTCTSTINIPAPITVVDEKSIELTCTVRQLDMRVGCGKICKNVGGLKRHEQACLKNVNKSKK